MIIRRFLRTLRFIGAYTVANVQAAMEYRISFWVQILIMAANDSLWLFFWWTYFHQFPLVHGWRETDIVVIWAISACSYGVSVGIFGNAPKLAVLIMNGGLDAYLGMPRYVLLHASISASDPTAWGDILFAIGSFLVLVRPDPLHIALFFIACIRRFVHFYIVYHHHLFTLFLCGQYRWPRTAIPQCAHNL